MEVKASVKIIVQCVRHDIFKYCRLIGFDPKVKIFARISAQIVIWKFKLKTKIKLHYNQISGICENYRALCAQLFLESSRL